jgi:hypothetical protein
MATALNSLLLNITLYSLVVVPCLLEAFGCEFPGLAKSALVTYPTLATGII